MQTKPRRQQAGFTLIELMIVVAIIGVLAAIAVPQYQKYVAKSEASAALASLTGHRANVETYVITEGSFPEDDTDLTIPPSPIGEMTYVPIASGAAGSIKFEFNDTGVSPDVLNKNVYLNRTGEGAWDCTTDIEEKLRPKGCGDAGS
ncbi:pilin [Vibrio cholerae]